MSGHETKGSTEQQSLTRLGLLRRLLVFQIKLAMDGMRDVFLSPVALLAVALGLVAGGKYPDGPFRRVLAFGRRTDQWIDLFDTHGGPLQGEGQAQPTSAEGMIDRVEAILREEFTRGGSRKAIEGRLAALRRGSVADVDAEPPEASATRARIAASEATERPAE